MIISRTPVRISFFGGGTDYREYYCRNGGAVLGTTIDKYVYVSLNRLSKFFDYKIRVGYSQAEFVNSVDEIAHPSVRACLKHRNIEGNLDIHIFADLPARSGLGSSSAFTVGFLHALYALEGKIIPKDQLAEEALFVEQEILKENVGSQDQIHAAHGGMNVIEFADSSFKVYPVVMSKAKRQLLEDATMIVFTGQTRYANEVVREQIERTKAKNNDMYLKRIHETVPEAVRIISEQDGGSMLEALGRLMHESWELKKLLSSQVSNALIDTAYSRAVAAGAYGGKISGAGGGGFLTMLVDPSRQPAVREALKDFLEVTFKFSDEGSSIIYMKH